MTARTPISIIAVGASLGGLEALQRILPALPAPLCASVVIAQHRRRDPDSHLCALLARHSALPVTEPEDKTPLELDHVYLAPADYHLLVEPGWLALSVDAPVSYARPSIDVLFESVADAYGPAALGVMLTSANHDGADGLAAIKHAGGIALVQDPSTAESPAGPLAALAKVRPDAVVPLDQLATRIVESCRSRRSA
jgi:two-component system, chemotaxis family, protein-glutamate methylesterase/glutaminase